MLDARVKLVALQPDHCCRHPVVAARVVKVGYELRDIVALVACEIPALLEPECEAIKAGVALAVDVVLAEVGVVPFVVGRIIHLRTFDGGGAFVKDVTDLLDGALMFLVDVAPSLGGTFIAENLGGSACTKEEEQCIAQVMHGM